MDAKNSAGVTWACDVGEGRRSCPGVVHLSSRHLFVSFAFWTQFDRDQAVTGLNNNQAPVSVFGRGTHVIPLADISEPRFSHALNLLEIYHGTSNKRYAIQSPRDPVHVWVYAALRERLAPDETPEAGFVSRAGALSTPLWGFAFTLVTAGLFSCAAAYAKPNSLHTGRGAWFLDLIEPFMYRIGFAGAQRSLRCRSWASFVGSLTGGDIPRSRRSSRLPGRGPPVDG